MHIAVFTIVKILFVSGCDITLVMKFIIVSKKFLSVSFLKAI